MKKQFETKEALDRWIEINFPAEQTDNFFEMPTEPDMEAVAKKLEEEGYDLDDLTKNGEDYEINGHANNGWFWAYKSELKCLEESGVDMNRVRVR